MSIDDIRKVTLTEDAKMEMIADYIATGGAGINVVQISNMSGTLSDEDFEKIKGNNCMMMASTQYFYKQFSAATLIRYGALPRISNGKIIAESITVDRDTKHYEFVAEVLPVGE